MIIPFEQKIELMKMALEYADNRRVDHLNWDELYKKMVSLVEHYAPQANEKSIFSCPYKAH